MYRRRFSNPYPSYHNLKLVLLENRSFSEQYYRFTYMIRQVTTVHNVKSGVELLNKNKLVGILREKIAGVPRSLKDHSASVLRVWVHQCECVFAQRIRRGQQMFSLYSKLWEEKALREFIKQMRQKIGVKGRDFVIGALGVAGYDWRINRITDDDIKLHKDDLEYIYKLKDKTLCKKCTKNSRICQCEGRSEHVEKPILSSYEDWKVFIDKNDLIVWRRMHSSGNYEYKVYGSYEEVSAEDFLNVQIDIDYRRQWDTTAVTLKVVESDPEPNTNSDIVYWEILWPKLFANRDYVFNRRYFVDYKSKTLFLASKSTKHQSCPKEHSKYRIEDYWSYMVIKSYTDLNKPGIEFSLTYFDNPGVNIPASVTTWVAMKAMPEFLQRLREASRKYKSYCQKSGVCRICNIIENQGESYKWDYFDDDIIDNTIYEAHFKLKTLEEHEQNPSKTPPALDEEGDTVTQQNTTIPSEPHSFWRYLHPTYYFS